MDPSQGDRPTSNVEQNEERTIAGQPSPNATANHSAAENVAAAEVTVATYRPQFADGSLRIGATAAAKGKLALRNRCLVVVNDTGVALQPIFPEGEAAWDGNASVLTYADKSYRIGEVIMLGGGTVGDVAALVTQAYATVPQCDSAEPFIVSP